MWGTPSETRGQSSVIGVALLLAITVIGVTAVVGIGSLAISDTEDTVRAQQAESAMTAFDARAAQVALGDSPVQTVELGGDNRGTTEVKPTGRIVIEAQDGTEYVNQTMGTLTYETGGAHVAYQGGGVWRGTENESLMVSPPEFHYRDGTLTFPVIAVNPAETGTGQRVTVRNSGVQPNLGPGRVQRQFVTVRVTSDYYMGWAQYFRTRIDGVNVRVDHANETVEADLARLELDGNYDNGLIAEQDINIDTPDTVDSTILAGGGVSDKHGTIECADGTGSTCYTENEYPGWMPLDAAITTAVENAEDEEPDAGISGDTTLAAGAYYSDGFELDGDTLTLDLSGGNVSLFVDGNIGLDNGKIEVVNGAGTDNYARIYTNGDYAMANGDAEVSVDSGNATRFQLYGTSEMHFAMGQSEGFTGAVYAPRDTPATGSNEAVGEYGITSATASCPSDVDVCLGQGSGDVNGAIVGGSMSVEQATSFEYDEDLAHLEPAFPGSAALPPPITYLHISVNRIDVEGTQAADGTVSLPTPNVVATLTISEQSGGDEYRLDAAGTSAQDRVDEYRWDFEDDGSVDRTTSSDSTTVECQSVGGPLDCTNLPDDGAVTAVDTDSGDSDSANASYPSSGGGGGSNPPSIDSFSVTDTSQCSDFKGNGDCKTNPQTTNEAQFDVSWAVSDDDGDLDEVTVEVRTSGSTAATYSGYSASETYTGSGDYGDEHTIRVTAEDEEGNRVCEEITDSSANGDDTDQSTAAC